MASSADSNVEVPRAQANEQDSKKKTSSTQLVEDLDNRLEELQDRIELCDRLREDFEDLRRILADKNVGERTIESIQQDPSN